MGHPRVSRGDLSSKVPHHRSCQGQSETLLRNSDTPKRRAVIADAAKRASRVDLPRLRRDLDAVVDQTIET
jgi:hypothetical protein